MADGLWGREWSKSVGHLYPLNLWGRGGGERESGESLSAPHHPRVSGVETAVTLYERANIDVYALLLNSKKRTLFECQCVSRESAT